MPLTHLHLRMEFMAVGEELGWPRIPLRAGSALRAGQGSWETFARAPIRRLIPALRAAKVRRDNLRGQYDAPLARVVTYGERLRYGEEALPERPNGDAGLERLSGDQPRKSQPPEGSNPSHLHSVDEKRQRMLDNLAKARAARKAKKVEA